MAVKPEKPQPTTLDKDPANAWQGLACWRMLDTRFEQGKRFFESWQAWRTDPQRSRLLHYVALTQASPTGPELSGGAGKDPALILLAQVLASQWFGLQPGFHRFLLDQGQVVLTLCVGDTLGLLRQQQFEADTVALHVPEADADALWTIKALARCCRRGTGLVVRAPTADALSTAGRHLSQCGFDIKTPAVSSASPAPATLEASFNPHWALKNTRQNAMATAFPPGTCAVIGAGLAGASVAAALARRGWQVTVLDRAEAPAAGASGLPVGLVVPHVSADDCALSRLSRSGVRLMLQQARSLLVAGQDWAPTGVLERDIGNKHITTQDIWHPQAAWLKPAQLVRAWLSQPGITFMGKAEVAQLRQRDGAWELLDAHGQVLCCAGRVVLANACGAATLLQRLELDKPQRAPDLARLPAIHGMRGLLSWAMHDDTGKAVFPPHPVNGSGSMVPRVPMEGGTAWFMGSSYQPDSQPERPDQDNHLRNWQHLQPLLPELAQQLQQRFESGALHSWKNTRCITTDRLPAVGPLETSDAPGLWICAGLGSRGLSFSVLCADLLAARWGAEPWPVEASLAKALNALRH
ncbi:FAD-dependent oxidoreductase [Rhodoferax sp.]|uniref:FAD-dependent oxidoreductase n=1 Tax=Rhodoferax sp. TaxID=50421 RepID=UPI0025FD9FEE|nr:FAD-dependent oxidoreductase [Rhodoferax sp.]MCM2341785.1 FAD-dependent oxidoreductase [Rhodoferax sp.]